MITIRDVARQAGVSVATVSRVLNNSTLVSADTREAVMKAVSELDYRPNANAGRWQLRLAIPLAWW